MITAVSSNQMINAIDSMAALVPSGTKSASYAVPPGIRNIAVNIIPYGIYSAISTSIQSANNDVDTEYMTIYTSTIVSGESVTISDYTARFIRILVNSSTGGTGLVIGITGR